MSKDLATAAGGVIHPEDLRLLDEVFEATAIPNETDEDRETRAAFIVAKFQAGVRDRDELIAAVRASEPKPKNWKGLIN